MQIISNGITTISIKYQKWQQKEYTWWAQNKSLTFKKRIGEYKTEKRNYIEHGLIIHINSFLKIWQNDGDKICNDRGTYMLKQPWHFTSCRMNITKSKFINQIHVLRRSINKENVNHHHYFRRTSTMKKELGDCTRRLSLCFFFSSSAGGWRRSISFESTCQIVRSWKRT
jgi:hypothetical protein